MVAHPHSEPRPYPLMLRTWDYRWWKPVVGILVLVVGGFFVMPLLLLPVLAIAVALEGGSGPFIDRLFDVAGARVGHACVDALPQPSLASLILVCMGVVRFVHRMRPRWLSSVLPGMRWKFFFVCFGLAVVALIASIAVGALPARRPQRGHGQAQRDDRSADRDRRS